MEKLITTNHKLHIARQLLESVSEVSNTAYYLFVGDHIPRTDSTVPSIYDKQKDVFVNPYRNMIMGKRVGINDMSLMIRNIPYASNTIFAHYDDDDNELNSKDFYVVVDEGSYKHVYICIDNNGNSASTIQPDFSHVNGSNNASYETSDGYKWKYMYSVSSSVNRKFGTTEYIPVVANNIVTQNARDGAIDFIKITSGGRGYDNYITGIFNTTDIGYLGQPKVFRITNSVASSTTDFYKESLIYLTEGTGSGQYANVESYVVNSSGRFITTQIEFSITPDATTEYEITPKVNIFGDGSQTINAVARALVNSTSSNSIYKIEILERGLGYDYYTAEVVPPANNSIYIQKAAELRTIASPAGGHGFDVARQLNATRLCVSVKLEGTESNTILTENEFKQIGILRDPLFSNVNINFTTANGILLSDPSERIYKISPKRFNSNVITVTTSANIQCDSALFTNQLSTGDYVYLVSGDNTEKMLTTVRVVHNNSIVEIASNAYFTSANASIYYANVSSSAYVANVGVNSVKLANVSGVIQTGDELIGYDSGAYIVVDSVERNGQAKTFNTFIQLYKYKINVQAGEFVENEVIYQQNLVSSKAFIHSIKYNGVNYDLYTSNQVGQFTTSATLVGNTSGAIGTIIDAYSPEIVFGSGDIMYIENTEPFERANTQSETFKVIFEF